MEFTELFLLIEERSTLQIAARENWYLLSRNVAIFPIAQRNTRSGKHQP